MAGADVGDRASKSGLWLAPLRPTNIPHRPYQWDARDEQAVVDSKRRVRAIAGLRVVDASIWPDVPSGVSA